MNAIQGPAVPDVITSSQTWALSYKAEGSRLINDIFRQLYHPLSRALSFDWDDEWSEPGVYRLQVRLNRPEGRPLYSLKWEGPL